jgi:signal transduction histidine kinase
VGCCNESRNKHAAWHHETTGHPVIRSFEHGESWMWCYLDQIFITGPEHAITRDYMRRLPLFSGLPEEDLEQLFQLVDLVLVPAGTIVAEEGALGDAMYVIVDGRVEITKRKDGQQVVLAEREVGEFVGEMALLEQAPRSATVRALRDTHLLVISQEAFQTLLARSPSASLNVLHTVTSRLRSTESLLTQQEKMAALGKLAAGLAHELNNPAAAIRRTASHLQDTLSRWKDLTLQLSRLALSHEQIDSIRELHDAGATPQPAGVDALARSAQEDDLQDWLEDHGIERAYEVAPVLVSAGWDTAKLRRVAENFADTQLPVVVALVAAQYEGFELLGELGSSSEAISQIVSAVKTYSYLDQAPIQDVDLHQSLETTLVILRHKLKEGTNVSRAFAEDLPCIEAHGSELNQVWTNLIDNAIDAMGGRGTIVLRTARRGDCVLVEIVDSGPGIPPEVQPHIFEPFFTTKAMGSGTGLGLHIVYNIVVHKHHGQIEVASQPGETRFRVTLPTRLG